MTTQLSIQCEPVEEVNARKLRYNTVALFLLWMVLLAITWKVLRFTLMYLPVITSDHGLQMLVEFLYTAAFIVPAILIASKLLSNNKKLLLLKYIPADSFLAVDVHGGHILQYYKEDLILWRFTEWKKVKNNYSPGAIFISREKLLAMVDDDQYISASVGTIKIAVRLKICSEEHLKIELAVNSCYQLTHGFRKKSRLRLNDKVVTNIESSLYVFINEKGKAGAFENELRDPTKNDMYFHLHEHFTQNSLLKSADIKVCDYKFSL